MNTLLEHETINQHPVHDLMRLRRSPRAFSDKSVTPQQLRSVLEAARWAPSANNRQPWHFIIATKDAPELYERLFNLLMDGNKRWAGNAPVLLLAVATLATNPQGETSMRSLYDLGLATAQLTAQATALGLSVHQMGGFHADLARQEFAIPDGFEPVVAIALGYPDDPENLPEDLREREQAPRSRQAARRVCVRTDLGREFRATHRLNAFEADTVPIADHAALFRRRDHEHRYSPSGYPPYYRHRQ